MKLVRWSTEEIEWLKNNHDKLFNRELSKYLGRTVCSIISMKTRLGLYIPCEEMRRRQLLNVARLTHLSGEDNHNWKNGITANKYHYKKLQVLRYPERVAARKKVYHAIAIGKLVRLPCEICESAASFAHHDDYTKPLEVRWLCRKHHREIHQNRH